MLFSFDRLSDYSNVHCQTLILMKNTVVAHRKTNDSFAVIIMINMAMMSKKHLIKKEGLGLMIE